METHRTLCHVNIKIQANCTKFLQIYKTQNNLRLFAIIGRFKKNGPDKQDISTHHTLTTIQDY